MKECVSRVPASRFPAASFCIGISYLLSSPLLHSSPTTTLDLHPHPGPGARIISCILCTFSTLFTPFIFPRSCHLSFRIRRCRPPTAPYPSVDASNLPSPTSSTRHPETQSHLTNTLFPITTTLPRPSRRPRRCRQRCRHRCSRSECGSGSLLLMDTKLSWR